MIPFNYRTILLVLIFSAIVTTETKGQKDYDVVIYGGTSAGIAAAIQSSRMGKTVVLIEPTSRIGGLTTGGLGATDIGNKQAIGGISREFYQNIKKYYEKPENWKWQSPEEYRHGRNLGNEDAMWTFEPSAAISVYKEMMAPEKIELVYNQRLDRSAGVIKQGVRITEIRMESGISFKGKMFIDATYEGDLMAVAGVSYTYGRESNKEYGETLNGVQANKVSLTLRGTVSRNSIHHNFIDGVDPYIVKGDPSSGLLPFIIKGGPGIDGHGDKGIQAYCFRMTLTDHPDNRIPFKKPEAYNEQEYELLFRNYEAAAGPVEEMYSYGDPLVPWINTPMPNRKTDTNNQKGFSTDFIGQNFDYPEASYDERKKIVDRHRDYQQGLMWSLAYHPRIPQKVRDVVSKWGTCKDEYEQEDGWQEQLYIREARRMISDYVMTQKNCEGLDVAEDPVSLAAYGMDSHQVQRYVDHNGYVQNEGNVEAHGFSPYPVSYRSIIPKKGECSNLLVPVCVSSTHIAFGSIRMEPVFMILGQSAAVAASMAIDNGYAIQDVPYDKLKMQLLNVGQILLHKESASAKGTKIQKNSRPNFIVIFADDLGYGDIGVFGHPNIKTPNLDKMAIEGQKWTNFYVASSVCSPSRAALLTGRLPIRSGITRVLHPRDSVGLPGSEITIAKALRENGYRTAAIGKWHLGHNPAFLPTNHGFDSYYGIPYSNDMDKVEKTDHFTLAGNERYQAYNVPLMRDNEIIERPADQRTITKRYTEEAVAKIKSLKGEPFFIYLAHSLPHIPLFRSEEFKGVSEAGFYGDVIEEIDWSVGQILKALKEEGLDENTLVVFSSDNGPWHTFKTHGGTAGMLQGAKGGTFEGGFRVPAIFSWPGTLNPETVMDMGTTMDLMPTFCKLSGTKLPNDRVYDGFDISPLLLGTGKSSRDIVFYYRGNQVYAIRKGDYKAHFITQLCWGNSRTSLFVTDPEKEIKNTPTLLETPLLFNLSVDPSEKFNISAEHPGVIAEIRKILEEHQADIYKK